MVNASCESDSEPKTTREHPLDSNTSAIIVDHTCRDIDAIPQAAIEQAKSTLHVAYGHTSHGSQLVDGMTGLVGFKGALYSCNDGGTGGALDLRDTAVLGGFGPRRSRLLGMGRGHAHLPQRPSGRQRHHLVVVRSR